MKIDYLCLGVYCSLIFWLSNQATIPAPMWFNHQDKLYHAGAYAVMGYLAWRCFRYTFKTPIILALAIIVFCSLYGVSDEWHQSFVVSRNSSIEDWIADTLGAAIMALILMRRKIATPEDLHAIARTSCEFECGNCSFHK